MAPQLTQRVHEVRSRAGRWAASSLWDETRTLPGGAEASVRAFVVPASGVGWVDCVLRPAVPNSKETSRHLADWSGRDRAGVVREVIALADEWFIYCAEQLKRLQVVTALSGAAAPLSEPVEEQILRRQQELAALRQQELAMRRGGSAALPPPDAGQDPVQGVLSAFTGSARFGPADSPGDGLGEPGDYVAES